jgi:1L-myo-inositol 1-phosphate cytidylyltransferase / CDP-L-myo-inositol myo-inositolphosphotransferase
MTIPAVILFSDVPAAQLPVGGISLAARHIKELYKHGVREFYLCGVRTIPPTLQQARLPDDVVLYIVPHGAEALPHQLQELLPMPGEMLFVRGDCLVDPRLFAALLTRTSPYWLPAPRATADSLPVVARLARAQLDMWATAGLKQWLQHSPVLKPEMLDDYSPMHRGPVSFYVLTITTPEEAEVATRTLIRAAQKCALDLPALVLDPVFENRLVFWLCHTRITPNQVTVFTGLLGGCIAFLFLHGWLRLGITLAYAVEVLDGVDGKLARTKLQTSRLGELEHVLDFFMEHAWYLTITSFLVTSTNDTQWWWIGGGLMLSDLLDNLLYYAGHVWLGKQLDELGPFDRGFRLIAGRRNIYAWMWLLGFWAGLPTQVFVAALGWAIVTVGVHGTRLVYHLRRHMRAA